MNVRCEVGIVVGTYQTHAVIVQKFDKSFAVERRATIGRIVGNNGTFATNGNNTGNFLFDGNSNIYCCLQFGYKLFGKVVNVLKLQIGHKLSPLVVMVSMYYTPQEAKI